jgi:DNA polymerase III epsilon subunit-like protein
MKAKRIAEEPPPPPPHDLVLVFDTETTGFPRLLQRETLDKQPYLLQLSYVLWDPSTRQVMKTVDHLVQLPEGVQIPAEATAVNRITHQDCQDRGRPLSEVMAEFQEDMKHVSTLVAHNIDFDVKIMQIAWMRVNTEASHEEASPSMLFASIKQQYCTMKESTDLCRLERTRKNGNIYWKSPKLSELHEHLFGTVPEGLHDALVDVQACLRCFVRMRYEVEDDVEDEVEREVEDKVENEVVVDVTN